MSVTVCKVWFTLLCSVVTIILLGLELAFNVYAIPLKETFILTQSEVELVSAASLAGLGGCLVEAYITKQYGANTGYVVIWIGVSTSAILMWVSVISKQFLQQRAAILCALQFFMSLSEISGSLRLTAIIIDIMPARHSEKLIGLGLAASNFAKIFYGQLYQLFFDGNLQGFFLTAATSKSLFLAISFVVRCLPDHDSAQEEDEKRSPEETPSKSESPDKCQQPEDIQLGSNEQFSDKMALKSRKLSRESAENSPLLSDPNPVLVMMKSSFFHLTFWPSVVTYSIMYHYMNNVTSIAHSLRMDEPLYLVYVLSLTIVSGRVGFGVLFDKYKSNLTGFILMLIGSICTETALMVITLRLSVDSLYFVTVCFGVGLSVGLTIPCSVLSLRFGQDNFSFILGCIFCFNALFYLIFQILVGTLYDQQLNLDGFCYGFSCFFASSVILMFIVKVFFCIHIVNLIYHRNE